MIEKLALPGALLAAVLTWMILRLLQPLAHKLGLLDHPVGRKDHAHPTPVIGGPAMLLGVTIAAGASSVLDSRTVIGFIAGAALLVVVGLLDDKYDLRWWLRILAHVAAALLLVYIGGVRVEQLGLAFGFGPMSLGQLSVPFTVFATVGLINAVNMIDGADGLAGSLVLTALIMLVAAALYAGNSAMVPYITLLCGAVIAFLFFNLRFPWQNKARFYMGNAGSAFLGFAIAWVAFGLTQNDSHPVNPVLALWLIPVPVMDTLVLMVRRLRMGHSPFHADHNHIHHLMRDGGFSPTEVGIALSLFSALCGLLAGQAMRMDVPHPLILLAFFILCAAWFWLTSRRKRATRFFQRVRHFGVIRSRRSETK